METKEISKGTLERVKTLPRIDYLAYKELITQKQVRPLVKLKTPRTIFFDEDSKMFLYLNPFHKDFNRCGCFFGDEMITLKQLSNALQNVFFHWDTKKHISRLKSFLEMKPRIDFDKRTFLQANFELEDESTLEYHKTQFCFHYFGWFYDALIDRNNNQTLIDKLIKHLEIEK
jgi:hypothetical protein